jgi:hypothetical protein
MALRASYTIFISHGFKEHEEYKRFVTLLTDSERLPFSCSSEPTSYKYRTMTKMQLEEQLRNQIRKASCFIALDAVYQASTTWVEYEMKVAGKLGIPIIGIKEWKCKDISEAVESYSKSVLGWNIDTIIAEIKANAI